MGAELEAGSEGPTRGDSGAGVAVGRQAGGRRGDKGWNGVVLRRDRHNAQSARDRRHRVSRELAQDADGLGLRIVATMPSSAASASQAAAPLAEVLASFSEAIACSDDEGALDGTNGLTAQNGDLSREKRIR